MDRANVNHFYDHRKHMGSPIDKRLHVKDLSVGFSEELKFNVLRIIPIDSHSSFTINLQTIIDLKSNKRHFFKAVR